MEDNRKYLDEHHNARVHELTRRLITLEDIDLTKSGDLWISNHSVSNS